MSAVLGVVLIIFQLIGIEYVVGNTYIYLGCFADNSTHRDLNREHMTYHNGELTLEVCIDLCVKVGWPYAGLQDGNMCNCGFTYGKYGRSSTTLCNYTCNNDREFCGGYMANSIFYTVKMDATSVAWRDYSIHEPYKTYDSARQVCVLEDGDLASILSANEMDNFINVYDSDPKLSKLHHKVAWLGLRYAPFVEQFEWADQGIGFNSTGMVSFWSSDNPLNGYCVAVDLNNKHWFTTSCDTSLPFICNQNISGIQTPTPAPKPRSLMHYLALFIGLPLFIICYGGSCVAYTIHRLIVLYRGGPYSKVSPWEEEDEENTEIVDIHEEGPAFESEAIAICITPKQHLLDNSSNRSTRSEKERIDFLSSTQYKPPPGYNESHIVKKKMKEPLRNALLMNALKEARSRRMKEKQEQLSSPAHSLSSLGTIDSGISTNQIKVHDRIWSPGQSSKSSKSSSSQMSSTQELSKPKDMESDIEEVDPAEMSISDIIKAKRCIREAKRKKGRGIITA